MKMARLAWTLILSGAAGAWIGLAGTLFPALDPVASFMPLFATAIVLGVAIGWRGGWRVGMVAILALLPAFVAIAPELLRSLPVAPGHAPAVRILTHNVWVDNDDPARTAEVILDAQPDVVLLQEVGGNFRPMLAALQQALPFFTDCPPGCNLAILSRWPIADRDYFLKDIQGRPFGPPLAWARIIPPGMAPFRVATRHYAQPLPAARQADDRAKVVRALGRIDTSDLIFAGDMNLTPWTAAMRGQDADLTPMIRYTRAMASWRRPIPSFPIDHLYAGPKWELIESRRLPATGSDHYPILVSLGRRL